MAPRANWKGHLKLDLVSCGVALYTAATEGEEIHLNMLNRRTGNRLRRQFVDAETGDVVEREDQVKGYELDDGRTIILEEAEIEAAIPESTKMIEIEAFVPQGDVDTLAIDNPYFLAPTDRLASETFALLREAMRAAKVAAIARAVLFRRDRVLLLSPEGPGVISATLHFDYEIRPARLAFADIPEMRIKGEMLELAQHIIEKKRGQFDPAAFEDRYEAALAELIRAKQAGRPPKAMPKPARGQVVDLMEALRQSAGEPGRKAAGKGTREAAAKSAKPAASRRKAG